MRRLFAGSILYAIFAHYYVGRWNPERVLPFFK